MDNAMQIALMLRDMEDADSDLFNLVFLPLGVEKKVFIEALTVGINKANEPSFYGGFDTIYAAYASLNGKNAYFKFSAPKEEMDVAAGSSASFLEMYCGGVYLSELSAEILLKYVMPFYYKEFGTYSNALANEPWVKRWGSFMVSTD